MPSQFVIYKEQRLVVSTAWDSVTAAEILDHRERLLKDPAFDPTFNQLVDGRRVTELEVSMEQANAIAGTTPFAAGSRRAVVASGVKILGMARLMETYARRSQGREQVCVFHSLPPALKWLGLEKMPE